MHGSLDIATMPSLADLKEALLRSAEACKLGAAELKDLFFADYFASFADTLLSGLLLALSHEQVFLKLTHCIAQTDLLAAYRYFKATTALTLPPEAHPGGVTCSDCRRLAAQPVLAGQE